MKPYSKQWKLGVPFTIFSKDKGELMIPVLFCLPCGDLLVGYADKGDVFFATGKLLRSSDGGKTWRPEDNPMLSCGFTMDMGGGVTRMYSTISFAVRNSKPKRFIFQYRDSGDGGRNFGPVQWAEYAHDGERYHTIREDYEAFGKNYGHEPLNDETIGVWKDGLIAAGWRPGEWADAEFAYHGPLVASCLRLPDGSLLNIFQGSTDGQNPIPGVQLFTTRSEDNGVHWTYLSRMNPTTNPPGVNAEAFKPSEVFAEAFPVLLDDGRIYTAVRNGHGGSPLLQTWSADSGRTWTPMQAIDPRMRGIFPVIRKLADGAIAMVTGRPGMYLLFAAPGTGAQWEIGDRLDIWEGEALTLKVNAKPDTVRTDLVSYMTGIVPGVKKEDMPWARQDLLNGNFLGLENVNFVEVSPGRILLVYDLQSWIEHPGAAPKKALRGVWITRGE